MVVVAPPNPESRDIAKWFTDHEQRIKRVEAGLRTAQLGNSSLNGSGMDMFDADGNYRGTVGFQGDGTTTVTSVNPLPPPVPGAPTVTAGNAHLLVTHSGETADGTGNPADFSHLNVYTADAGLPEVRTLRGTISPVPGEFPVTGLDYTQYLVTVTGVNLGGKESAHSAPSSGTPTQVVSADLTNGIIQEVHLNSDIVGAAHIKADAVTATKIAPESIETPHLVAGSITSSKIAANQINAGHITAGSITTEKIAALAVTADTIAANAITAGKISAGSVTATKLEANLVLASRIIAGSATGARVEMHPTSGLQAYQSNGTTRTFWINATTGEAYFAGEIETAVSGVRIVINPNGTVPDEIRFVQSNGTYAYINAEIAASNQAAVVGRGSTTNRGQFAAYPNESYVGYFSGTNQTALSACSANNIGATSAIDIWGGQIDIQAYAQYGSGSTLLSQLNSSGGFRTGSTIQHRTNSGDATNLYGPYQNTALYWTFTDLYCGDSNANAKPFAGAAYTTVSGASTKKNIQTRRVRDNGRSYRDGLRAAEAKEFNYSHERAPNDPEPREKTFKRSVVERDERGEMINRVIVDEPVHPQPITKPYLGFVAEDIIDELPELVNPSPHLPGGYGIRDMDVVAFLWMVNKEQDAELVALRNELELLKAKVK